MLYPQIIRSITNGFLEPGFTGKLARFLDRYTPIKKASLFILRTIIGMLILVMRLDWDGISFTASRANEASIQLNITPNAVTL